MFYCQEKYQKALDDFDEAVNLNRQSASAFASRGTVYDSLTNRIRQLLTLRQQRAWETKKRKTF